MNAYIEELRSVVALPDYAQGSMLKHARAIRLLLEEEQAKPSPNNALIATLCDAARIGWELGEAATGQPEYLKTVGELKAEVERLNVRVEAGYKLSTYAASITWEEGDNTQVWLDGLRERIEKVQALKEGE